MLTTAPHLYIRRPSPTTAEFTVTTCPPLTLPLRLALLALSTLRLSLAATVLFALYTRFITPPTPTTSPTSTNHHPPFPPHPSPSSPAAYLTPAHLTALLHVLTASAPGQHLARLTAPLPPWLLSAVSGALLYFALLWRLHTTESLLVLRGLGIQTATTAAGGALWGGGGLWGWVVGFGGPATRFIPTEKIRDVLINEAFQGFEVRYYLVVVVDGEDDVVVVFPRLLPGRRIVETVWRGVRGCLYEAPPEGGYGYDGQWKRG
ncbi:GPI-GlcNAc transferase complex, PIG-H component-domain-containing protein [Lasiosphaeris hirsuta]|uniref:GPI-GlcNAc transferase complex, PIG-H component-domain-containing protein n=1 Tax=Lasiosphaeris hirsuta TaxID=260670 RepID=A0AA40DMH9_9PEZI|nr:GPI-GlcNAc transferase complex, PIG-H component-domain-containing protein [Lasiosphaeris hirsuta]